MKPKRASAALTLALLAGVAGGGYLLLERAPPAQAAAAPVAATRGGVASVRVAPALRRDVPVELRANGTVVSLSSVEIRPHVGRQLTRVHVREGQFVGAGALLFSLDDRAERAALDRAQAQLARDQAALGDLERQFKRSQDLSEQRFISTSAADSVRSQAESQRALVLAGQAAVRAAQVDLSYTAIRAPCAGRVGAVSVYAGSLVQANAVLATVTQIDPIAVSFTVPEGAVAALLKAHKSGAVDVSATLPGATLNGKLSFIDSTVDAAAGTIRVKAQFDNAGTRLWPGQFVQAQVTLSTLRDVVVVPLAAVVTRPEGSLVYAVDASQLAQPRKVRVLHAFGNLAAVSGLEAGEQIVTEGKQNLKPGARVRAARDELVADAGAAVAAQGSGR